MPAWSIGLTHLRLPAFPAGGANHEICVERSEAGEVFEEGIGVRELDNHVDAAGGPALGGERRPARIVVRVESPDNFGAVGRRERFNQPAHAAVADDQHLQRRPLSPAAPRYRPSACAPTG